MKPLSQARRPVGQSRQAGQSGAHAGGRARPDALAAPQLPAPVERADGQRDGLGRHPACAPADRRGGAPRLHLPGRRAHRGGDPPVRADRPPGRRHRGPARQAVADDLVRRRPDADHRLGPGGRRVRRAHLGPVVRGRHRRRGVHRVLRRVLSELPARPDRHRRPGRRERQARRHAVVRAAGRAGSGRRPGRPGRRGPGHVRGRDLLRGLGGLPARHPRPRGSTAPGPASEAADRDRRGAFVRPAPPDPAQDRGLHRNREPVLQHGRRARRSSSWSGSCTSGPPTPA